MPGHNIAWFLALSVAIHTVLLLAYHPALPEIGHAGHIVQLSVERAGSHSSAAVPEASKRTPEIAEEPDVPETRASAQPRPAAAPANPAATRSTATAAIPAGPQAAPAPESSATPRIPYRRHLPLPPAVRNPRCANRKITSGKAFSSCSAGDWITRPSPGARAGRAPSPCDC